MGAVLATTIAGAHPHAAIPGATRTVVAPTTISIAGLGGD
jgi:hypothetical protein